MTSYTKTGNTITVTLENITTGTSFILFYQLKSKGNLSGSIETIEVDSVLACVGYRPDKSITQELQVC